MVDLVAAFPGTLQVAAADAVRAVPEPRLRAMSSFVVRVRGEQVVIPSRLYSAEPDPAVLETLPPTQRTMVECLYTRHHDGRVRQRYLRQVIGKIHRWVAPFVVQLVGEYVVEIVLDVREHLVGVEVPDSAMRLVYGGFAAENWEFLELTYQRAASYWDCYYRGLYATRQNYPAFDVLRSLREAARDPLRATGGP